MEHNTNHHNPHLNPYFTTATTTSAATPSPSNGGLMPSNNVPTDGGTSGSQMLYPHSAAPSSAGMTEGHLDQGKKKRGRPRKYGTPEQALAAKKMAAAASTSAAKEKREAAASGSSPLYSSSGKKLQHSGSVGPGYAGQGFTPHIISVAAGEDVSQKLMSFLHQSKREMCVLSASGSISNASLRQPATSGGSITYEGRFEIISLSGSYIRTDIGGRSGGLSVCLSNTDGQIIGGGVAGPIKAAGPVQVIVGTFNLENKDIGASLKGDASGSNMQSPTGVQPISNIGFRPPAESAERNAIGGNDDHQNIRVNPFLLAHNQAMHTNPSRPTDWRDGLDARISTGYDLTGAGPGHGTHQSPENGDYGQFD